MQEIIFKPDHPMFIEMWALIFPMSTLSVAVSTAKNADNALGVGGHYISARCAQSRREVQFPIAGPTIALSRAAYVEQFMITIDDAPNKPSRLEQMESPSLDAYQTALARTALISFFERHRETIEAAHGTNPYDWPSVWNFGRVARNAAGHRDTIKFKNPDANPVSWRGLTYQPSDNGKTVIGTEMLIGDIVELMLEMSTHV